jgi:chaperone modulatory protein CbpM
MQPEPYDVLWLDRSQSVSISDLVDLSGLTEDEVRELVDVGALAPSNLQEVPWTFSADCVVTVRKASRLRDDLELDSHALVLALTLLEQIRILEAEVARLRAQLPTFRRY